MTGINEVAKQIHENAVDHGWWDEERGFPEVLALIHSEVSEALEEYRNGRLPTEVYAGNGRAFAKLGSRRRGFLQSALWTRDRKVGKEGIRRSTRGVRYCTAYSRSNGYSLFSRLHIRESRNPLRSRAASLHRRRRERQRSRALPFYGSYL